MKTINFWYLCLVLSLSIGNLSYVQSQTGLELDEDEQLIEFTTDRFTLPNLHVTPDKKHIIFDVLGDIYQVPIEGGTAKLLLQDKHWKRGAKLSPDGKILAYISDELEEAQIWTYNLLTQEKKPFPVIFPYTIPMSVYWSSTGQLLIPSKKGLQAFDMDTDKMTLLRKAKEEEKSLSHIINRKMSVDKQGENAFFHSNNKLWVYDIIHKTERVLGDVPKKYRRVWPVAYKANEKLVFYKPNDDARFQDLMLWDLKNNTRKILKTTRKPGLTTFLNYSFDFINAHTIVLDKEGEIVKIDLETGDYKSVPIEVEVRKVIKKPLHRTPQYIRDSVITASVLRNPVTQPNLDTIYFGAFGKLHTYSKTTGEIQEVYPDKNRFEVSPSLSPDGKYLAYTTWNDWDMGHLYVREILTGKESQITNTPGRYINPTWSPDGTEIVYLADNTEAKLGMKAPLPHYSDYFSDICQTKVFEKGKIAPNESTILGSITPATNIPRRFYPILTYSSNGKELYFNKRNKNEKLAVIQKLEIESKKVIEEHRLPFHIDEVVISPDSKQVAFIFDDQIWLDRFPFKSKLIYSENSPYIEKRFHVEDGAVAEVVLPDAELIYEIAPSYLYWQDEHTLMWGSTDEIYTYDVRTQKTQKIADIKVQKPKAVPQTQYALTHARIITVNKKDEIIEEGTILIKNNRIEAVGKTNEIDIPQNYKIFDLSEKTVIPGLVDVHAHYHYGPYEFTNQQEYQYIGNLAFGVTTIYDPSVNVLDYREQAQMVETGDLLGPRVFASGNVIMTHPKEYDYRSIEGPKDADRVMKSLKKYKIGGPVKQYNRENRLHRKWLYDSAKKYGMSLTNHETDFIFALTQIVDGYTAAEHQKYGLYPQEDVIQLFAKSGVNYTPTFMVSPGIGDLYMEQFGQQTDKLLYFNGERTYYNDYGRYRANLTPEKLKHIQPYLDDREMEIKASGQVLHRMVELGGLVSVGGHGNPFPGIGTHMEIWAFTYDGLSNYEALKAATINGAKKIDLQEEIGSIENGKLADMVILNHDPLENIFNTTAINYIIQNGNLYEGSKMEKLYPVKESLQPWGWENPRNVESVSVTK